MTIKFNRKERNRSMPSTEEFLKYFKGELTLIERMDMQAPWSLRAKYTPFLLTGMDLTSVLIMTSLLLVKRPSSAAILSISL